MALQTPYDTYDYPGWWKGREFEHKAEVIAIIRLLSHIERRKSIVDVGGGFGRLTQVYAPFFSKITILDPSEHLLVIAREYLKDLRSVSFVRGSAEKMPLPDDSFDVALCIRIIHHFESPEPIFSEIARTLKPGGFLILEFANKIHFPATLRSFFKGNFGFRFNTLPEQIGTHAHDSGEDISFVDHHPQAIKNALEKYKFDIVQILSVSNFRYRWVKKIIPSRVLLYLEEKLQNRLARVWFGPSSFILAQKRENSGIF